MTAVQMTEAGKPAPVDFRGRAGSGDQTGAGTAVGLRERYLVPVLGLCLLVATTAYLMVFTLLRQIGAAALRSTAFARLAVRLGPGGSAHAWLKVTVAANYPAATCDPVTADWLKVYPPAETAAGYVGQTFSACGSASAPLLTILPVRAGKGAVGVTP